MHVLVVFIVGILSILPSMARDDASPIVIPITIDIKPLVNLGFQPGDEVWVQVTYRASPDGPIMFEEPGEKVWWVQDRAFVLLGATGALLPSELVKRTTLFVHIEQGGEPVWGDQVMPRRDAMVVQDEASLTKSLGKRLVGVDGTYLAQVAHYLAQNVATLDVRGTSYSVDGWGTVINGNGDWTGGRLAALSPGFSLFVGSQAGVADDGSNNFNTGMGYEALRDNTTGSFNVALGSRALLLNSIGSYNTATGDRALSFNTTGLGNVASGFNSLSKNTTGSYNSAYGYLTMLDNTTGDENTAFGSEALRSNTDGSFNTALGANALKFVQNGDNNTAVGHGALQQNLSDGNTALGFASLQNNVDGSLNTAIGRESLNSNVSGNGNIAIGPAALFQNATGWNNVAIGVSALSDNVTGNGNTAVGYQALRNNEADSNTAMGYQALDSNREGIDNTVIGYDAFGRNATGSSNTVIGANAMPSARNERVTALGADTKECNFCVLNNATIIGAGATGMAHNSVRLGDTLVTSIGGEVDWSTLSDGRFKTDVRESVPGLAFIEALRPVNYRVDRIALNRFLGTDEYYAKQGIDVQASDLQSGFIAQEVQRVAEQLGITFSGVDAPASKHATYGLRYGQFVVPLVKAVQEQQQIIDVQGKELEHILRRLEAMEARLAQLEPIDDP